MEAFTQHIGTAAPLRRSNVDTDQIIPAVYLKRVTRTGFEDGLFAAWRNDPAFVLNQPEYEGVSVLVAGPDFGTGSSREHAVWALLDYGFRVVVSSRFGDIFRGNSGKAGLLAALVDQDVVEQLWTAIETDPGTKVTVDLEHKTISAGDVSAPFEIDDYTRYRLLNGLDDVGITLSHADDITAYEATRPSFKRPLCPRRPGRKPCVPGVVRYPVDGGTMRRAALAGCSPAGRLVRRQRPNNPSSDAPAGRRGACRWGCRETSDTSWGPGEPVALWLAGVGCGSARGSGVGAWLGDLGRGARRGGSLGGWLSGLELGGGDAFGAEFQQVGDRAGQ